MVPIVRLVPNTLPRWDWRAATLASQRVKRVWDRGGDWRRTLLLFRIWRLTIEPLFRLADGLGRRLGLRPDPVLVRLVDATFWWVL